MPALTSINYNNEHFIGEDVVGSVKNYTDICLESLRMTRETSVEL